MVDPGNLVIVREIKNNAGPADIDTSNYEGPRSQYTITANANGSVTVCDSVTLAAIAAGGLFHESFKGDGCDILWRIERLQFADQLVTVATATAPAVTTTPAAAVGLAFGNVVTNTTSASQTVTVRNTGTGPLTVSGLSLTGTGFTITANTCLAGSVAAGGTCTVNVAFAPTAIGSASGSLLIADNAAGSPQSVALSGTGIAPAAAFVFGNQTVETHTDSNAAGLAEAFKTTSPSTGQVTQLRVFVDTGSVGPVIAALYSNSATNHPLTRLTTGTLAAPVAGQFNTISVPAVNVTANTTYWIAVLGPNGTFRFRDRANVGAGSSETSSVSTLTAMPATWTTGAVFTDGAISAFAAGSVTVTPPPPPPPGLSVLVGNAANEAQVDSNLGGRAEAFKTTATTTGSVQSLRIFLPTGSAAASVVVRLYSNTAANRPGTLLTVGTIAAPTANAQNSVAVPPAAVTAGQTYWIAVMSPLGSGTVRFLDRSQPAAALGRSEWSSAANLTALPNTWVSGTQFRDGFLTAVGLG